MLEGVLQNNKMDIHLFLRTSTLSLTSTFRNIVQITFNNFGPYTWKSKKRGSRNKEPSSVSSNNVKLSKHL